jgi:hypothetical protein
MKLGVLAAGASPTAVIGTVPSASGGGNDDDDTAGCVGGGSAADKSTSGVEPP